MKRLFTLFMAVVLLMTLAACGNEKAEKYCWNCGEGIAKTVSFCPSCGVAQGVAGITTTTQEHTATAQATAPSHTHSYSKKVIAATCTEKGYTKYACSCGDTYKDNYTNPEHNYSQYYICTKCGIHDKEHTYEFLVEYVKRQGTSYATRTDLEIYNSDDASYYLSYDAEKKHLYINKSTQFDGGNFFYSSLNLESYFYGISFYASTNLAEPFEEVTGFIDAKNYTLGAPLENVNYSGPSDGKENVIEIARVQVAAFAEVLSDFANQSGDMQLTMADMGFLSY